MQCARKLLKFKGYNNNRTLYQCVRGPKQKPNYRKYVLACGNEIAKENLFAYCPSVTPIVKMIASILSMFKNCLLDNFFSQRNFQHNSFQLFFSRSVNHEGPHVSYELNSSNQLKRKELLSEDI